MIPVIPAKNFKAIDHKGETVSLSDFEGKTIWLAFFRYASCPLCNLHIREIQKRYDEIVEKGIVFLPVFQSPAEDVSKHITKDQGLPFKVLCDPNQELYDAYDVKSSVTGFFNLEVFTKLFSAMSKGFFPGKISGKIARLPSDFLINKDHQIIYRFDAKHIGQHADIDEVLAKL